MLSGGRWGSKDGAWAGGSIALTGRAEEGGSGALRLTGGAIGQDGKTDVTCMRVNGCRRILKNVTANYEKQQT